MKLSKFVWAFCILSVVVLIASEFDDKFEELLRMIIQIMFIASIGMVFILSIINYLQIPPDNIFINYENLLR